MPDNIVQQCVPARWSGTNIKDFTVGLSHVSSTGISAGSALKHYRCACKSIVTVSNISAGECCNRSASLVRLLQT